MSAEANKPPKLRPVRDERDELTRAINELNRQLDRLPDQLERKFFPHRRLEMFGRGFTTVEKAEERRHDRWAMRVAVVSAGSAMVAALAAVLAFVAK